MYLVDFISRKIEGTVNLEGRPMCIKTFDEIPGYIFLGLDKQGKHTF